MFADKKDEAHPYLKKAGSFLDSTRCTIPGWIGKDHLMSLGGGGGRTCLLIKRTRPILYLKKAGSFLDSTRCTIPGWIGKDHLMSLGGGGGVRVWW